MGRDTADRDAVDKSECWWSACGQPGPWAVADEELICTHNIT